MHAQYVHTVLYIYKIRVMRDYGSEKQQQTHSAIWRGSFFADVYIYIY